MSNAPDVAAWIQDNVSAPISLSTYYILIGEFIDLKFCLLEFYIMYIDSR